MKKDDEKKWLDKAGAAIEAAKSMNDPALKIEMLTIAIGYSKLAKAAREKAALRKAKSGGNKSENA